LNLLFLHQNSILDADADICGLLKGWDIFSKVWRKTANILVVDKDILCIPLSLTGCSNKLSIVFPNRNLRTFCLYYDNIPGYSSIVSDQTADEY
jgi:hypothetical protein